MTVGLFLSWHRHPLDLWTTCWGPNVGRESSKRPWNSSPPVDLVRRPMLPHTLCVALCIAFVVSVPLATRVKWCVLSAASEGQGKAVGEFSCFRPTFRHLLRGSAPPTASLVREYRFGGYTGRISGFAMQCSLGYTRENGAVGGSFGVSETRSVSSRIWLALVSMVGTHVYPL